MLRKITVSLFFAILFSSFAFAQQSGSKRISKNGNTNSNSTINNLQHKSQNKTRKNAGSTPILKSVQQFTNQSTTSFIYSFSQKPNKVVVNKLSDNQLQIRIKPAELGKNAYNKKNNGVIVSNKIERGDVLVSNITLSSISDYTIHRTNDFVSISINNIINDNSTAKRKSNKVAIESQSRTTKSQTNKSVDPKQTSYKNSRDSKSDQTNKICTTNNSQTKNKTSQTNDVAMSGSGAKVPAIKLKNIKGKYTVVIDPGHGGEDPGTISQEDLTMEKNITLSVGKLLEKELKQHIPNGKIIITRNNDRYITLAERSRIANKNKATIFVSLHCNAAVDNQENAHGFECYIFREKLAPSSNDIAESTIQQKEMMENKLYNGDLLLTKSILYKPSESLQPQQSANSWQLANWITKGLGVGTNIKNRGIHKAHFYVLAGTNMPAVLVEMGYITHEKDRSKMKSISGQKQIAKSVAHGVINYLSNSK